jgi:hypothetical protein
MIVLLLPGSMKKEKLIEPHPVWLSSCQKNRVVEAFLPACTSLEQPLTCFMARMI